MNLCTWNMQGSTGLGENKWNAHVKRLFLGNVDIALLQEAGTLPSSIPFGPMPPVAFCTPLNPTNGGFNWLYAVWNLGTQSRPNNVGIYWVHTDSGGNRCNLAIAFRMTLPMVGLLFGPNPIVAPAGSPRNRPAIGVRLALPGGGTRDIWTIHAFSGGGGDAPGFCTAVQAFAAGGAWFLGGDFNRAPTSLPALAGCVVCNHNPVPTHPGSDTNLDYAVKNAPNAIEGVVSSNFVVSDHYPVSYLL